MMDLYNRTGKMAIGSRLRLLTSRITEQSGLLYQLYQINLVPKWFPVFFVLSENKAMTITEIAQQIGHSQPSVTKIVKEMTKAQLIQSNQKSADKRRNLVGLTAEAIAINSKINEQYKDVEAAIESIEKEATHDLWKAIGEWERLLEQKSLFERVQEQRKLRDRTDIRIVAYQSKYKAAFKQLNEQWINQYFEMEEADHKALDHPEQYILKKGGIILVALDQDQPIGVCALIKMQDSNYDFEMAKMAVAPSARGKRIGWLLGQAIIQAAKDVGASKLYLESNTLLKPAISLYKKMGFQKIPGLHSPYKRANIHMELNLSKS